MRTSCTVLVLSVWALNICAFPEVVSHLHGAELPHVAPEAVGLSTEGLNQIETLISEGLAEKKLPGCVVCIGRHGRIAYLRAYGQRQLEPSEPMTVDTIFDAASLTKPVSTATSIMLLIERGKLRLSDRVVSFIPTFGSHGKEEITIRDLLIHQSGLIADNALADYQQGPEIAFERINNLTLQNPVRQKFVYSDVNFIVLGELVRKLSGEPLNEFARKEIFGPLGMNDTGYLPDESLFSRCAPTEKRNGQWMRGEVHDPRCYLLGGVAGHAGMFTTATDLALFAEMMLSKGNRGTPRVLASETINLMTKGEAVSSGIRGLGWDIRTAFSGHRGKQFSEKAYGHGGFTGNVFWIDPELDLFYIFLSNRVHPDGKGLVNPLAGKIATAIGEAVINREPAASQK